MSRPLRCASACSAGVPARVPTSAGTSGRSVCASDPGNPVSILRGSGLIEEFRSLNETTGNRVICLGEAVVDFVSDAAVERLTDARAFVPSFGGSQANTAAGAVRFGARSALIGCTGADPWGEWLRAGLESEGVDVSMYELRPDVATTMAFIALSPEGEPSFSIYGGAERGFLSGRQDLLLGLVGHEPPGVLAFGSDSLIVPADREVLKQVTERAARHRWRVLYDPNLRDDRWSDRRAMLDVARDALRDVTVVKSNAAEAMALTGEGDPGEAAAALLRLGPRQALVTRGAEGAMLAGPEGVLHIAAERGNIVDATGAGDAVAAVLAAGLTRSSAVTPTLVEAAMLVAARVVAVRGALAGLPQASEAGALLDV
jgi:fructokinase